MKTGLKILAFEESSKKTIYYVKKIGPFDKWLYLTIYGNFSIFYKTEKLATYLSKEEAISDLKNCPRLQYFEKHKKRVTKRFFTPNIKN